jgi:5-methylcytosine-specific restriction endonuclease McrA
MIRKHTKRTQAWIAKRHDWIRDNPPDEWGYWLCYLRISPRCLVRIDLDQLTIDHVIPRSRHKDTKLMPCCTFCNSLKGSRSLETLLQEYPHLNNVIKELQG